jgi:hypothetical protein
MVQIVNSTINQTPIAAQLNGYRVVQAIEVHWVDDRPFPSAEKAEVFAQRVSDRFGYPTERSITLEHPAAIQKSMLDRAMRRGELMPEELREKYRFLSIDEAIALYRGGSDRVFFDHEWQGNNDHYDREPARIVEWLGPDPRHETGFLDHLECDLGGSWWRLQPDYDLWVMKWERRSC